MVEGLMRDQWRVGAALSFAEPLEVTRVELQKFDAVWRNGARHNRKSPLGVQVKHHHRGGCAELDVQIFGLRGRRATAERAITNAVALQSWIATISSRLLADGTVLYAPPSRSIDQRRYLNDHTTRPSRYIRFVCNKRLGVRRRASRPAPSAASCTISRAWRFPASRSPRRRRRCRARARVVTDADGSFTVPDSAGRRLQRSPSS